MYVVIVVTYPVHIVDNRPETSTIILVSGWLCHGFSSLSFACHTFAADVLTGSKFRRLTGMTVDVSPSMSVRMGISRNVSNRFQRCWKRVTLFYKHGYKARLSR